MIPVTARIGRPTGVEHARWHRVGDPAPEADRLNVYRAKRNFDRNVGARRRRQGRPAPVRRDEAQFVVQKHAARRLHYDVRFEAEGVLISWAVPEGAVPRSGGQAAGGPRGRPPARLRHVRGHHRVG